MKSVIAMIKELIAENEKDKKIVGKINGTQTKES